MALAHVHFPAIGEVQQPRVLSVEPASSTFSRTARDCTLECPPQGPAGHCADLHERVLPQPVQTHFSLTATASPSAVCAGCKTRSLLVGDVDQLRTVPSPDPDATKARRRGKG